MSFEECFPLMFSFRQGIPLSLHTCIGKLRKISEVTFFYCNASIGKSVQIETFTWWAPISVKNNALKCSACSILATRWVTRNVLPKLRFQSRVCTVFYKPVKCRICRFHISESLWICIKTTRFLSDLEFHWIRVQQMKPPSSCWPRLSPRDKRMLEYTWKKRKGYEINY